MAHSLIYLIEMKFSTFFLIFVFGLLAFAQAAPGDAKPSPAKGKPKPKPKPKKHHNIVTMAPTMSPKWSSVDLAVQDETLATAASVEATEVSVERMGIVAVLGGVAVACVVAIVAVLRAPSHAHMPLPDTSEDMA